MVCFFVRASFTWYSYLVHGIVKCLGLADCIIVLFCTSLRYIAL